MVATAPIVVVEPIDVTAEARALGLRCHAVMFPQLAAAVDPTIALTRLRDALAGTEDDRAFDVMRRLVVHGEVPAKPLRDESRRFELLRTFLRRARAGIGGASPGGRMVALAVRDCMMLCSASSTRDGEPVVYLQGCDEIVGQRNLIALPR
jgi:hypothetical protein